MRVMMISAALALTLGAGGCVANSYGHRGPYAGPQHAEAAMGQHHQMGQHMGQQMGQHMGMGPGPLAGCHGQAGDADARLSEMRTTLAITTAQETAWNAYAEAYRAHAAAMPMGMGGQGGMMGQGATMTAPQMLQHHEAMMQGRLGTLTALRERFDALYAQLSPQQKAQADALTCGPGPGQRGM